MAKYDLESLLNDIEATLKAKLNTRIGVVEAEKTGLGSPVGLPLVDDPNGFFKQTWDDRILNQNPAVFYGIQTIDAAGSIESATAQYVTIFVEIVLTDGRNDKNTVTRLLRYTRAVREIFEEAFAILDAGSAIKIETVAPVSFRLDTDTSEEVLIGGITIKAAIA